MDSLISTYIVQFMGCVIGWIHYGLKVVFCLRHFTAFHYQHHTTLLMGIDHMYMFVGCLVEVWLTCCYSFRSPLIFITIHVVVCVQLANFSIGDWNDIYIAHVIIIIKSEVSTFPIVSCDQAALLMVQSVRPSVRLTICLSVTHFSLCSHHREMFRS